MCWRKSPDSCNRARSPRRPRHHAAETAVVACRVGVSLPARADHVSRAVLVGTQERPAAMNAFGFVARVAGIPRGLRPLRVAGRAVLFSKSPVVVGSIPIGTPFPHVAGHVEQAIAVRGKLGDRCDAAEAVLSRIATLHREFSLINVCHPSLAGPK